MKRRLDTFRHEYAEQPDPVMGMVEEVGKPQMNAEYTTFEYEGVVGESRRILGRIHDGIDERAKESNGVFERTVVLGVEDYLAADAWIRHDSGCESSLEDHVAADIVVVPGRMIHVPKTNERAVIDHLKENHE